MSAPKRAKKSTQQKSKIKTLKEKKTIMRIKDVLVPKEYSIDEVGLTQSLITAYMNCRKRFLLKLNRYTSASKNKTTLFGNIVHRVLELMYEATQEHTKLNWSRFIEIAISTHEQHEQDNYIGVTPEDIQFAQVVANVMLLAYVNYYTEDFTDKRFTDTEEEISVLFLKPFRTRLLMKLDGCYNTKGKAPKVWLMEHKTRSRISEETLMKRLSYDFQNLTYVTIVEEAREINIDGVLYNIIRKPQIRQRKGETAHEFATRLKEDIEKRPEFYFMRYEIPYTKADKKSFRAELFETILSIRESLTKCKQTRDNSVFYKNPTACEANFPCEFIDACASETMNGYFQKDKLFSELNQIT